MKKRFNPYDLGDVAEMMRIQRSKTTAKMSELHAELKKLGPASPYDLSTEKMYLLHRISRLVSKPNRH